MSKDKDSDLDLSSDSQGEPPLQLDEELGSFSEHDEAAPSSFPRLLQNNTVVFVGVGVVFALIILGVIFVNVGMFNNPSTDLDGLNQTKCCPVYGAESIMKQKKEGTCRDTLQTGLQWGVDPEMVKTKIKKKKEARKIRSKKEERNKKQEKLKRRT